MKNKTSMLFIVLLSFVAAYIIASAFSSSGIDTTTLTSGFLIVSCSAFLVLLLEKILPEKTE
jgi:hypothetical protein